MENDNLENQPPIVQPIPLTKKWYQHKGIITIIVLAFLVAIVSYIYFTNQPAQDISPIFQQKPKNIQPITNSASPINTTVATTTQPIASNTPTLTDKTNWQTYTNSIYGIQIKYPSYLLLQNEAADGADLNLTNVASTTYWQGITIRFYNNPNSLSPSDWWRNNRSSAQPCASDPKSGQIAGFNSIETDTDAKCIEFPNDHLPQIRSIFLFFKNRIAEFDVRNVPDADQIIATTKFTNPTNSLVSNGLISYDANNQLFTVTQKQFKVLDVFTPDYLENSSSGCYGGTHPLSYYQTVLSKFSSSDQGAQYDFNFAGKSQNSGVYEVTIIPNKPGYQNMDQFNGDFGLCDAGDNLYPSLFTSNYLLFTSACGTGYDDGSGLPHGCDEVESFVGDSIKLNQ